MASNLIFVCTSFCRQLFNCQQSNCLSILLHLTQHTYPKDVQRTHPKDIISPKDIIGMFYEHLLDVRAVWDENNN